MSQEARIQELEAKVRKLQVGTDALLQYAVGLRQTIVALIECTKDAFAGNARCQQVMAANTGALALVLEEKGILEVVVVENKSQEVLNAVAAAGMAIPITPPPDLSSELTKAMEELAIKLKARGSG